MTQPSPESILDILYRTNPFGDYQYSLGVLEHLWEVASSGVGLWAKGEVESGGGVKNQMRVCATEDTINSFDKAARFFFIIGVWAVVEAELRSLAHFLLVKSRHAPLSRVVDHIEQRFGRSIKDFPGFDVVDDARIIANCYKHNSGLTNKEWVCKHGTPLDVTFMASFSQHGWHAYELRPDPSRFTAAGRDFLRALRVEWASQEVGRMERPNEERMKFILERITDAGFWS